MKITLVPKPIPSEATIQMQKNQLMKQIKTLEDSKDDTDQRKLLILRQKLKEIEREREEKTTIEKKELTQMYQVNDKSRENTVQKSEASSGKTTGDSDTQGNHTQKAKGKRIGKVVDKRF